jgi:hypothetical protein
MPPGLYPRTPAMRTYGKTNGIRGDILEYKKTHTWAQTAKKFDISVATIWHLQKGDWNPDRKKNDKPKVD